MARTPLIRRRREAIAAGTISIALAAAGVLAATPAAALEGLVGIQTTLRIAGDIELTDIRYDLSDDSGRIEPGDNSEVGPAGPATTTTWSAASETQSVQGSATARIVDFGTVTEFWVVADAHTSGGGTTYGSSCRIYRGDPAAGGTELDQSQDSPYWCNSTHQGMLPGPDPRYAYDETFEVSSLDWATVRGAISPQGSVSLHDGALESPTTRFITDGRWYPADPAEQLPFLTIAPGATLDWAAFRRNGESTENASGYFSYRIYDGGVPTRFWVSGMASNWRGVEFNWDYTCQIFDGDPSQGALAVTASPYTCDMTTTEVSGRGDYRVDFAIKTAPIQTLEPLEARDLMSAGCGDAADACYFVPATNDALVEPGKPLGPPYANDGEDDAEYQFSYASGRSITNTVNVSVSAEANVLDLFKVAIKVAYGWEETDETEKKWIATMIVPAHEEGWFEFAPAYRKISGDFLFETGGTWYRVTGTFTVPDDTTPGTLTSHTRALSDEVEAEPPVTPTPAAPAQTPQPTATPAAASGALAATGSSVDPSAAAWLAGIAVLAGAALLLTRLARRGRRTTG